MNPVHFTLLIVIATLAFGWLGVTISLSSTRPMLQIMDFNKHLPWRKKKRFEPIERAAHAAGFYRVIDFYMEQRHMGYYGRAFLHGATKVLLAARQKDGLLGQKTVLEFHSVFSDGSRLLTTNSSRDRKRPFGRQTTTQFLPPGSSVAKCYDAHRDRLYQEVESGKKVIHDKFQKVLSFIEEA